MAPPEKHAGMQQLAVDAWDFEALAFLERSREVAAEAVAGSPSTQAVAGFTGSTTARVTVRIAKLD
jgi:hypothetical protein